MNPQKAARMACDRHSVKMVLESAQLLCSGVILNGGTASYGLSHKHHPSTKWVAHSKENWLWLKAYALALCEEYTHRYGRIHKSQAIIEQIDGDCIPSRGFTQIPLAMPDIYKSNDVVKSYRDYYRYGKSYMNKGQGPLWRKDPSRKPAWFGVGEYEPPIVN